ncbi:MAG: transporter substrate-binding domain-containing protein [Desulfuromonadales bacterium]|nr:transporter substrate-binding domain-containing protein [Desulfuromonadales bacterium]
MQNLFRVCVLLLFLCTLVSNARADNRQTRVIRVGAFNYYPGIFKDSDGAVKGFYVDALADVERRENIRFEYVFGSWSEGLERLKAGQVDLLTSVARTPDRAIYMEFGKTPLLTVWGELYAPLSSNIDGIRDIQGKKVAVMKGDFNARYFKELVSKFNITCEFIEMPGFDDVFKAVAAKKVHAGVVNSTFGVAKVKEYGLRSTGVVFNPFDIYFAVAKGKNRDLLSLLDSYLDRWRHQEDSVYNRARQVWSHGSTGTISVTPRWLINSAIVLGVLVLITFVFVVLLRQQVRRATDDLLQRTERLRESEERYRSIFEHTLSVMLVIDPENGSIVDANPAATSFYGWSLDELTSMSISTINTLDPDEHSALTKLALSGFRNHFQFCHRLANGSTRDVDAFTGPIVFGGKTMLLSIIHDISERKMIDETHRFLSQAVCLEAGEDFFAALARYLAENLEMDYVCIDRLQGDGLMAETVAIFHDGAFEDNVQYSLKDTPCGDVVGKQICCFERDVRHLFHKDQVLQEMAAESYVGATLWSFDGNPIGLIAIISRKPLDNSCLAASVLKLVSVRAAAELERREKNQELLNKNVELEHFTYTVSHDLKSPLITIQVFVNQIIKDLGAGHHDRIREDLDRISDAATKMGALLNDLLKLSRAGKVVSPPKLLDMNLLADNVTGQLAGVLGQRRMEVVVQPELPQVFGDQSRITMVLQNLVENAIKYMGDQELPRITIGVREKGTEHVFFVEDNGSGIEPRFLESVFDLFNKLDPKSEGTGIGLALVRRIVEAHNGKVWIESEGEGKGSIVCFTLPTEIASTHIITCAV